MFKNVTFSNIKLETLEAFSSMILGKEFETNDFIRLIYHVSAHKNNTKFTEPILQDLE